MKKENRLLLRIIGIVQFDLPQQKKNNMTNAG